MKLTTKQTPKGIELLAARGTEPAVRLGRLQEDGEGVVLFPWATKPENAEALAAWTALRSEHFEDEEALESLGRPRAFSSINCTPSEGR